MSGFAGEAVENLRRRRVGAVADEDLFQFVHVGSHVRVAMFRDYSTRRIGVCACVKMKTCSWMRAG